MKLNAKLELLKFCSTLLNFIFMVLGLAVGGCGLWILFDSSFISVVSTDDLRLVALAILSVGGVVVVVSVLGMVGVQREIRVLLLPVGASLLLLVLAQVFVLIVLALYRPQISEAMIDSVDKLIELYPAQHGPLLDNLQHYGRCCGQSQPSDWLRNEFVRSLNLSEAEVFPCSCFSSNHHESGSFCSANQTLVSDKVLFANGSYSTGCVEVLNPWLQENLLTIMGMDLGLIFIQALQLALVGTLYRSFGAKSSKVKSSAVDVTESDPDQDQDQYQDQYQDRVYSNEDLLHRDLDQGLYHEPYDGIYEETYEEPYGDRNLNYREY